MSGQASSALKAMKALIAEMERSVIGQSRVVERRTRRGIVGRAPCPTEVRDAGRRSLLRTFPVIPTHT